jgi:hypothetical protein
MLTGTNIYEAKPYISKYDPDKNAPTTFMIGALDQFVRSFIDDQTTSLKISSKNPNDSAEANILMSKRNMLAVKFGIKGLENFLDPRDANPVKFDSISVLVNGKNYPAMSDEILRLFPKELMDELAEVIFNANKLTEVEAKN